MSLLQTQTREISVPVEVAGITLSHPEKLLYGQSEISKMDLASYYADMGEFILPFIANRPLTLVRCPQGHNRHCFFQKHLGDSFDDAIRPVQITEKSGRSGKSTSATYAYVKDVPGLIALVQMGTLEIHAWGSRIDQLEKPDTLVFDLDPDQGLAWSEVKRAAIEVRGFLAELGLEAFVRTSGGKGLHVVIPIVRRHTWDEAKAFCKAVAQKLAQTHPRKYVATASKARRKNRIFIDYLRNSRGATSICCYSTRSKPAAPVATPLAWDELEALSSPQEYCVENIRERIDSLGQDPWANYFGLRQGITRKMIDSLDDN